jgi:hypothetical protein
MIDDDVGADFLPAKLLVILIVGSLLLIIMVSGINDAAGNYSGNRARAEAQRIYEFTRLAYSADTPDCAGDRAITVSIPASVLVIGFGAVPGNGTPVRSDRSYFIEYADGSTEIRVADMPFASDGIEGPADIPVLLYPGEYVVKARPASVNGSIKACIQVEAA